MKNKPEDISHIARDVLRTGQLTNEHVGELAKLTAKQIYSQGYQAGEMASKIDTWNEAIEAAIKFMVTNKLEEGLYERMRKELKK